MVIATDVFTGEKTAREIRAIPDRMDKEIEFRIESLSSIGFLSSQNWQMVSLRAYSNPLYWISQNLEKENLAPDLARQYLEEHLENLSQPIKNGPFGRYCRKSEKPNFVPL